jgi:hypothetical protein
LRVLRSSTCRRAQNDSIGVVVVVAGGAERGKMPGRGMLSLKLHEVNCVPLSACRTVVPLPIRFAVAMLTALLTRAVSAVVENVRATILREKQSRMVQQYALLSRGDAR